MKARMYWSYATRSLTRGGQRSLLAIFCVTVGVMAIVALQLVSNAVSVAFTSNARALNGGDLSISSATAPFTQSQLSYFDQLKAQGAVTTYTAVDSGSGQLPSATTPGRFFQVDAINPAQFPLAGTPVFSQPTSGNLNAVLHGNTVVVTTALAQTLNLKVGASAHLSTQDGRSTVVTIGGIIQDTGWFHGPTLLIALADYATLPSSSGQPIIYNQLFANVPGHTDASATHAQQLIQQQYPLTSIQTTKQALTTNQTQVQRIQYFLQIVGLLALLIGGVGIVNTMQVVLRRRRIEIAMLKTAGYQRRDLFALFGLEAGLIGIVGGVVGTAAGVGVSFLVKGLMQSALQTALPTTIDARTVVAGVAVGFVTALIFGLLPIAKASQVRPHAVLRELPEGTGWNSRMLSAAMFGALVVLFFALALLVVQNVGVAALAVGGTGVFLALLSLFLGAVVLVISKFPVLVALRWQYVLIMGVALLGAVALTVAVPSFGVLCLAVVLLGSAVVLLPRTWKANVKLALRNIGRQKARTVTTLLALYIGVFSVGLILVFGQNIKDSLNSFLASGTGINAEIIASGAETPAVQQQLTHVTGIKHVVMVPMSQAVPVAVNGQSIAQFVQVATTSGTYTPSDVAASLAGVQGYDLAHGTTPNAADVPLAKGSHDTQTGRDLTASDAGTNHALLPVTASQAPDNLKLGDTITLTSQTDRTPITLSIVGFYTSKLPQFESILTDSAVVNTLSADNPRYGFSMHLDPKTADATLTAIQNAVPGVNTFSLTDFVDQYAMLLNNLITVLVAVTSLTMLASIIIIANAVALAMLERRRELGILKAVGHTSRSVLGEVLIENGVVGFTGALLAMLVVAAAASLIGKAVFNLPIAIPTPTVLAVVAATVAVCMVVAATIAWGAARVRPLEVLRYE